MDVKWRYSGGIKTSYFPKLQIDKSKLVEVNKENRQKLQEKVSYRETPSLS